MFIPNKTNVEVLIKALNDDVVAFQKLVHLMNIKPSDIKTMLQEVNARINKYASNNNISREEAIEYYKNDILKIKIK